MRKDQQINVSISRTINMGNFNSLKVTAGYGYTITDDADVQEEYKAAWNTVNAEITRALQAFEKAGMKGGGK